MKIKIVMFLILGISLAGVCFAQDNSYDNMENNGKPSVNADTNVGITTSMNGSTSTKSGGSISSTSSSAESKNTSGSGI